MLIGYILSIVCLKLNWSLIYLSCNVWGCIPGLYVYSIAISLEMTVRIRVSTSSYHHHQIGSMIHLRLFKFRSWNNGMRYMSSYVHAFFFIVICRHNSKIEDLKVALINLINLSKLELSQLHTRTSKVSHNIHQVFGMFYWHRSFDYPMCNFNK